MPRNLTDLKALLKNNIKAYIARSAYGAEAAYPIFHEKDENLSKP